MPEIECAACGDCCENITIASPAIVDDLAGAPDPRTEWEAYVAMGWSEDRRQLCIENWLSVQLIGDHWREQGEDSGGRMRYRCDLLDPETRLCTAHEDRPPICRGYPWYSEGWTLARVNDTPKRCSFRKAAVRVDIRGVALRPSESAGTHG